MSAPVEFVRRHFTALARYDWVALQNSVSADVRLTLDGVQGWDWELTTLYRHVTQAWDYTVGDLHLSDEGEGIVRVLIHLVNGDRAKDVTGDYHVTSDWIDAITFPMTDRSRLGESG